MGGGGPYHEGGGRNTEHGTNIYVPIKHQKRPVQSFFGIVRVGFVQGLSELLLNLTKDEKKTSS